METFWNPWEFFGDSSPDHQESSKRRTFSERTDSESSNPDLD